MTALPTSVPPPQTIVIPVGYRLVPIATTTNTIRDLLTSKKFIVMVLGLIFTAAANLGYHVGADTQAQVLQLILVYLGAQGLADFGKAQAEVRTQAPVVTQPTQPTV